MKRQRVPVQNSTAVDKSKANGIVPGLVALPGPAVFHLVLFLSGRLSK